jgi:uncharacterized membrane protein YhaH (DUF805 family)
MMRSSIRSWGDPFDFKGRSTRTEYGLYHLVAIALFVTLETIFIGIDIGLSGPTGASHDNPVAMIVRLLGGLTFIVGLPLLYIAHVAISIRRLHDHGEPGIKFLLTFIPLIGMIFWVMMVFTRGDSFENDYGPDPRQPEAGGGNELGGVFS